MCSHFPLKTFYVSTALFLACTLGKAQSASELIAKGDAFDVAFQPSEALQFYLPAEKLEPKNVNLLLCIARQYRHLLQDATRQDEKIKMGGIGKDYAHRAALLAPKESEAHLSIAIGHVKMMSLLSKKDQVEATHSIKAAVDKAIALDSSKDLAWYVLGCWHQRLADVGTVKRSLAKLTYGGLPEGTHEDAVTCFQKAIKLNPNRLGSYIELGRTYAKMQRPSEARELIEKGLAMPNTAKDDPETKSRGRETLGKL